jgi:hypothetical protein
LFLLGIVVGVVVSLGLSVLVAGARRTASRAADARRTVARHQRELAFINRDHDTRLEHQQRADAAPTAQSDEGGALGRRRSPLLGRWSRDRQSMSK